MTNSNNKQYEETFYIIPRYIRKLPGMTLAYLDVYETIFQFWNKGKNCFLSEKALIERTGLGRTQIYEALSFFEKHGELKRIKLKGKRYLVKPEKIVVECDEIEQTSGGADEDVRSSGHATSGGADHNIKNINKEVKKRKIYKKKKADQSKKNVDKYSIKQLYQQYVGRIKTDIKFGLINPDTKTMLFDEWAKEENKINRCIE